MFPKPEIVFGEPLALTVMTPVSISRCGEAGLVETNTATRNATSNTQGPQIRHLVPPEPLRVSRRLGWPSRSAGAATLGYIITPEWTEVYPGISAMATAKLRQSGVIPDILVIHSCDRHQNEPVGCKLISGRAMSPRPDGGAWLLSGDQYRLELN